MRYILNKQECIGIPDMLLFLNMTAYFISSAKAGILLKSQNVYFFSVQFLARY